MSTKKRVAKAIDYAIRYGQIDGGHHKAWVIDQMVRALTGCPMETATAIDSNRKPYTYERQGKSDEYRALIAAHNDGEDGPETYAWVEGDPP